MSKIRVYADTSVFGGVFDEEFESPSRIFFEQVKNEEFILVTSAVVQDELNLAPEVVKDFFDEMLIFAEVIDITEEALMLRESYLEANIVTNKFSDDALHVALASSSSCSLIVSWNF
jgi:predicted nucleic acid-binding protein